MIILIDNSQHSFIFLMLPLLLLFVVYRLFSSFHCLILIAYNARFTPFWIITARWFLWDLSSTSTLLPLPQAHMKNAVFNQVASYLLPEAAKWCWSQVCFKMHKSNCNSIDDHFPFLQDFFMKGHPQLFIWILAIVFITTAILYDPIQYLYINIHIVQSDPHPPIPFRTSLILPSQLKMARYGVPV